MTPSSIRNKWYRLKNRLRMFLNVNPYAAYIRHEVYNGKLFLVADMWCHRTILQSSFVVDYMKEIAEAMGMDVKKEIPHYFSTRLAHLHPSLQGTPVQITKEDSKALEVELIKELEKFREYFKDFGNK